MKKKEKTKQKQSQRQSVIVNIKTEAPRQSREPSTKSKEQEKSKLQKPPKPTKPYTQPQTIPYLGLQSANNAQLLNSLQTSLAAIYRSNQSNAFSQATPTPAPTPMPTPAPISRPLLMPPIPAPTPAPISRPLIIPPIPETKPLLNAVESRKLRQPPLRITDTELMPPPPPRPPKAAPLTNPKNIAFKNVTAETVNTDTESEFEKPKRKTARDLKTALIVEQITPKTIDKFEKPKTLIVEEMTPNTIEKFEKPKRKIAKDLKTGQIVQEMTPETIDKLGLTYKKDGTINKKSKAWNNLTPAQQQDILDSQALFLRTKEREEKLTPVKEKETILENIIKEHKTHTKTEIVQPKQTNEFKTFLNPEESSSEVDQIEDK